LGISNKTIYAITKITNNNIEYINLNDCTHITEKGINYLIEHNTNLKELNIGRSNITDCCLENMAIHSKNLKTLDIDICNHITINGVNKLLDKNSACYDTLELLNVGELKCTQEELIKLNQNKSSKTFIKFY